VSTLKTGAAPRFEGVSPSASDADDLCRADGEIAGAIVAEIRAEVPAWRDLPTQRIREVVSADLYRGQAAMLEGRPPTEAELEESAATTAELARAGIPMEACIQARRIGMRRVFEEWRIRTEDADIDQATQVEYVYALWNWADAFLVPTSAAHREVEREIASRQDDRRAQFLRGLLEGTLPPAEAESRAAAYGLLPGGRYRAVRARAAPGVDPGRLVRAIESTGGADGRGAVAAVMEGEVCAVVSSPPSLNGYGVGGLGAPVEIGALDRSYHLASRALETALAFGMRGMTDIDELSVRPAILAEDHMGDSLVRRYLEPLRALGEFGQTLERTVREYLANGLRVEDSAKALIIHPNTMRHRLERFQQLTGADLHRTEDLVEVWWALERRTAKGARAPQPDAS
jgi:hypothetical protein